MRLRCVLLAALGAAACLVHARTLGRGVLLVQQCGLFPLWTMLLFCLMLLLLLLLLQFH